MAEMGCRAGSGASPGNRGPQLSAGHATCTQRTAGDWEVCVSGWWCGAGRRAAAVFMWGSLEELPGRGSCVDTTDVVDYGFILLATLPPVSTPQK